MDRGMDGRMDMKMGGREGDGREEEKKREAMEERRKGNKRKKKSRLLT